MCRMNLYEHIYQGYNPTCTVEKELSFLQVLCHVVLDKPTNLMHYHEQLQLTVVQECAHKSIMHDDVHSPPFFVTFVHLTESAITTVSS